MTGLVMLFAAGTLLLSIALLIVVLIVASRIGRRLSSPRAAHSSPSEMERRAHAAVAAITIERNEVTRVNKLLRVENHNLVAEVQVERKKSAIAVAAATSAGEMENTAQIDLRALADKNAALTAELKRLRADLMGAILVAGVAPSPPSPAAKAKPTNTSEIVVEPPHEPQPPIVTRTTTVKTNGVGEFDEHDKVWSSAEDHDLLSTYCEDRSTNRAAVKLKVDQRQVAIRLVTLLMDPSGEIDDESAANFRKAYGPQDTKEIVQSWRSGRRLPAIARNFNRSQLGIGWKLLDHPEHPVELTPAMIPAILKATW